MAPAAGTRTIARLGDGGHIRVPDGDVAVTEPGRVGGLATDPVTAAGHAPAWRVQAER